MQYYHHETIVARKHYLGVTIGYIVGWKSLYGSQVRNIRADLIFKTALKAQQFRRNMEHGREQAYVQFEILESE